MKRLLSLMTVCALFCSPAFGQEAQSVNNYPELSIITRIDAYPFSPSVFTLLEGSLGDHLSYSVCNNWVSDDTPSLYANTLRADEADWCQWAYLSLDLGNWHIQAGKNYIFTGGFEIDAYDFDQYWQMTSNFWNNAQVYQWGGALQYVTPSESDTFSLQVLSSPFSGRPFEGGLLSKSLEWRGEHGIWSSIWGISAIGYEVEPVEPGTHNNIFLFSAGNQWELGETLSLGLDYMYRLASPIYNLKGAEKRGPYYGSDSGHNVVGRLNWRALDWMDVGLRGVFENRGGYCDELVNPFDIPDRYLSGGLCIQFYPIPGTEDLRIHALAGTGSLDGFYWGAGVTYNFNLTRTLLNRRAK
ncbi:MAG: hypothetical protein IJ654_08790 [Bacteroidales bacterium]|nr:hypothetical protein [Bacteroidales bacterium]